MNKYTEYNGKVVTLMLCSACNVGCKHCYISYTGNRTIEELSTMIPILQSKGYRIDLNGAEVLTNPDYLQFYKDTGFDELMTNGLAIYNNPTLIGKIKENGITTGIKFICSKKDVEILQCIERNNEDMLVKKSKEIVENITNITDSSTRGGWYILKTDEISELEKYFKE